MAWYLMAQWAEGEASLALYDALGGLCKQSVAPCMG